MRKVYFYVDGFNLYHRALEDRPHLKWLCLRTLVSKNFFPRDEISSVKYFTAPVDPPCPGSKPVITPKRVRQLAYWDALRSTGVTIVEGRLVPRWYDCRADCGKQYRKMAEKMSDVSLALHMYRDFIVHRPQVMIVLSADLDLLPALKMIREEGGPQPLLQVLLPTDDDDTYFSRQKDYTPARARLIRMDQQWLVSSQFKPSFACGTVQIAKPAEWV
jgi:hypothetical protein